jgi:hypothetical protein
MLCRVSCVVCGFADEGGCSESGAPLALRDHIGRHLVKVEPAEAIRDVEYYRRAVTACLVP